MSLRLWEHRVVDILEAIRKIQTYVEKVTFGDFQSDPKTVERAGVRSCLLAKWTTKTLMTVTKSSVSSPAPAARVLFEFTEVTCYTPAETLLEGSYGCSAYNQFAR
jgi:hypothetical protein